MTIVEWLCAWIFVVIVVLSCVVVYLQHEHFEGRD